ncbi:hypothetical protein FGG08_005958 [Glutinoglossum americanum]|uniref:UspA domain-containing protein n=1 Tax=Glutinoglossum americanum TaxID=1670608 RepID=A0A9P8I4F6_9PEZI|nr:hypothetical protein FGG08_005958 [Glutinoglossum americanum]
MPSPTTSLSLPLPSSDVTAVEGAINGSVNRTATSNNQRISFSGDSLRGARRPSVKFAAQASRPSRPQRRISSPPPPAPVELLLLLHMRISDMALADPQDSTFQNRVSFDTFDNKDAADFSLTLNVKHKDYAYTRRSRTFLCGTDQNDYSEFALEWLIDELVDDGDEIVCLRVVDKDSKISSDSSLEEGRYRLEAKKLLDQIIEKNTENKSISVVLEFAVGKVQETIQRMIRIYEPAILIVGTRGRSLGGLQGLLPGSVSKYCLQHSPVPVIVVRPTSKREKKKKKRQADPNRRGYLDILERSAVGSEKPGHVLDRSSRESIGGETPPASEGEALAVAKAVGLDPATLQAACDAQVARNDALESSASPSPVESPEDSLKSPGVVLKSPDLGGNLESPESSESDDEEEKAEFEVQNGEALLRDTDVEEKETRMDPKKQQPDDATQSETTENEKLLPKPPKFERLL